MNLRQLATRYLGCQGEPAITLSSSAGSYLTKARGRNCIDFMRGWCVGNLGWGNTEIRRARLAFSLQGGLP